MPPEPVTQPMMLRSLPQRPSMTKPRTLQGPIKVLQSNRTPAQLSLFERPFFSR